MSSTSKVHLVIALSIVGLLAPATAAAHDRPMYAGFGGGPYLHLDCCRVHARLQGNSASTSRPTTVGS